MKNIRKENIKKKIQELYKEFSEGKKTINEVRKELGLLPIDNGDILLRLDKIFEPGHRAYITDGRDMDSVAKESININGIKIPTYTGLCREIFELRKEITKTRIISAVQTIILALAVICISIKAIIG